MREPEAMQTLLRSPLYKEEGEKAGNGHGDEPDPLVWQKEKPQFNVKAKDMAGYVGSGSIRLGKFGNFIRVYLHEALPKGAVLFVSPRRGNEGLLGR